MKTKKLLSLALVVLMCLSLCVPAMAANSEGITYTAVLEPASLTVSDQDQTIVMYINGSTATSLCNVNYTVVWDEALALASIAGEDFTIASGDYNLANGKLSWTTSDMEDISGVDNYGVITFTVPANTPAGEYQIGIEDFKTTRTYATETIESGASVYATVTINEASAAPEGYTAGISSTSSTVTVGDTVTVNVAVNHGEDTSFNAGEIKVSYDTAMLSFTSASSTLGTAEAKNENGTITLEDYGADKSFGTAVYTLAFEALADGSTTVSMTSAAFADKVDAEKSDLIAAEISPEEIAVTIEKEEFSVTLPDIFTGDDTVTAGEDYTFAPSDSANYDYDEISATVDGTEVDVINNNDGTYTIENVTGDIVITGTRTEKRYSVTVAGSAADDITDAADFATYDTDYTFTMPSADGWSYSLESITIGGTAYTGYTVANSVYTIPGSAITGVIVITVNKTDTEASVTVEGSGAGAAAGYDATVDMDASYTLTITPVDGYDYTVTATMGGQSVDVTDNGDNTYTIAKVTGDIVFTVEAIVVVDGVSATQYLTLDGTVMWLVKNEVELADGSVSTYDGNNMFWSEKYNAYCYLVVADTLSSEDAADKVGIATGDATAVDYGMDVNKTGKVDASDAQLVYNMYNALYSDFTADVIMEKFLRADVNGDEIVNVTDATAIIASILA